MERGPALYGPAGSGGGGSGSGMAPLLENMVAWNVDPVQTEINREADPENFLLAFLEPFNAIDGVSPINPLFGVDAQGRPLAPAGGWVFYTPVVFVGVSDEESTFVRASAGWGAYGLAQAARPATLIGGGIAQVANNMVEYLPVPFADGNGQFTLNFVMNETGSSIQSVLSANVNLIFVPGLIVP